jgi:thioredoxin-related protein
VTRLLVAGGLVIVALLIAAWLRRRQRVSVPTQPTWQAPAQLDRLDFPEPDKRWLVVLFSSSTCHTCADMGRKAAVLASHEVGVVEVEALRHGELHRKYGIEAVPMIVVAGPDGAVQARFIGPATATDLWAAVAEARAPGSTPEPGLGSS